MILEFRNSKEMYKLVFKLRNLLAHRTSIDTIGHNDTDLKVNIYIRQNDLNNHIENWIKKEKGEFFDGNDPQNAVREKYKGCFEKRIKEYLNGSSIDTKNLVEQIDKYGLNIADIMFF